MLYILSRSKKHKGAHQKQKIKLMLCLSSRASCEDLMINQLMKMTLMTTAAFTLFQTDCLLHLLLQCHAIAKSIRKYKSLRNYGVKGMPQQHKEKK